MAGKFNDRTGAKFGLLTVQSFAGRSKNGDVLWLCTCDCGGATTTSAGHLTSGHTRSCGCERVKVSSTLNLKHGQNRIGDVSPEYSTWGGMHSRCVADPRYAGRGITVCDRWASFEAFFADMGVKPSASHSLERVDNDKGYSPENCIWATMKQQARNRRTTLFAVLDGIAKPLIAWCEHLNMDYHTVRQRISRLGWSDNRALRTPTNKPYMGL